MRTSKFDCIRTLDIAYNSCLLWWQLFNLFCLINNNYDYYYSATPYHQLQLNDVWLKFYA